MVLDVEEHCGEHFEILLEKNWNNNYKWKKGQITLIIKLKTLNQNYN